jgi:polyisoprenoid-binding protein YceI
VVLFTEIMALSGDGLNKNFASHLLAKTLTIKKMGAKKWIVDPLHSEVQFKVKHLVISTVTGFSKIFMVVQPARKII